MKRQRSKSRIIGYLLLLAVGSLGVMSATYARYLFQADGEGTVAVAVWGTDATITPLSVDVSDLVPGKEKAYTFQVTNTRDGKTSQVAQEYSFVVETTGNLPLVFDILAGLSSPAGSGTTITEQRLHFSTDGKAELTGGSLPHTTSVTHTYTMKVSWPDDAGSKRAEYADEIDLVTLTVKADQIMPTS